MSTWTRLLARISFILSLSALLGACSGSTPIARVFPVCSWAFESNGRGITNIATPDTHASYWVMPFDTQAWKEMVIRGTYAQARFFNFDTYTDHGLVTGTIVDKDIVPDPGSTNPFATPTVGGSQNYTVSVSASEPAAPNRLHITGSRVAFVVYRLYLPDQGRDPTEGVGLPAVNVVAPNGAVRQLQPCPFTDAETRLPELISLLAASGFLDAASHLQEILTLARQSPSPDFLCNPNQPGPVEVPFPPATLGANFFPNPQTTYLETPGFCFQPGKILVIRGKAPVFPDTYTGGSVFQPAFDGQIQLRYWSMCNNVRVIPYPVVGCQADFETRRDQNQFYTYVVSNDPGPPPWLPAGATWIPWGPTTLPQNLIFRSVLPSNFEPTGDFVPRGVFCDQAAFINGGAAACFAAAGVALRQAKKMAAAESAS
jgi:hypothetical protein